jgi:hypothetical protein
MVREYGARTNCVSTLLGKHNGEPSIDDMAFARATHALEMIVRFKNGERLDREEFMNSFRDALIDAGCYEPAITEHCRGLGPHAPGCWVLDLLLARQ